MLKPNDDSATLVLEWLNSFGVVGVHDHQWVTADVTVAQAEELLQTKYNVYFNPANSNTIIRTPSFSLPYIVTGHVDLVEPTTMFGMTPQASIAEADETARLEKRAPIPRNCIDAVTPNCIRALYNTVDYAPSATDRHSVCVVGFHGEYANMDDLKSFLQKFRPDAVETSYTTISVNGGGDDQSNPSAYANLGIQYAKAITHPTPLKFYSVDGNPPFIPDSATPVNTNEPLLEYLSFLLLEGAPQTLVIGYAANEQTIPKDYATKVCNLFAQLGSIGVSVIVASGDAGVGGGDCKTNDGSSLVLFQPMFPASCPFVTSVGSTDSFEPEVAASFSGGGFSRYFMQQDYQRAAVSAYLDGQGKMNAGLFMSSGRGYPDVAALASKYQVVERGQVVTESNTAASATVFASVVSLLNDAHLATGKPPLGLLNSLLYSKLASELNDVVMGSNPSCGTNGFTAGPGWDPVTGLDTPNFTKMMALV
ncbi:hypothetical protein BGZ59_000338 [Podila verticillata]|nr:hypothetical protein BGZ59_000338 [Podila verticillata]